MILLHHFPISFLVVVLVRMLLVFLFKVHMLACFFWDINILLGFKVIGNSTLSPCTFFLPFRLMPPNDRGNLQMTLGVKLRCNKQLVILKSNLQLAALTKSVSKDGKNSKGFVSKILMDVLPQYLEKIGIFNCIWSNIPIYPHIIMQQTLSSLDQLLKYYLFDAK